MASSLPQTPPAGREDVVGAGAEQAEDQDCYGKEEETAYLATAFGLPVSCWGSGLLWHGVRDSGQLSVLEGLLDNFETELREWLVGKEVDAKFEVRALEVCG